MLHGDTNKTGGLPYVGNVPGNTRLNIPPLTLNDGPQGFRDNASPGTTTAWPSGLTMAASFDKDIMFEWGSGMGKEFKAKGSNVQLGPGLCLARAWDATRRHLQCRAYRGTCRLQCLTTCVCRRATQRPQLRVRRWRGARSPTTRSRRKKADVWPLPLTPSGGARRIRSLGPT